MSALYQHPRLTPAALPNQVLDYRRLSNAIASPFMYMLTNSFFWIKVISRYISIYIYYIYAHMQMYAIL